MAFAYDTGTKTARMTAVRDQIDSHATLPGYIEVGTAGMASVLATFTLADPSGTVSGDTLTLDTTPALSTTASASGKAIEARVKDGGGTARATGVTVGLNSTAAPAWAGSTAYALGAYVTNGANQYKCTTAGTSASSGGPTGTGTGITDGTAVWAYYSPAGAHLQFDSLEWTASQTLNLTAGTIVHAA